MTGAAGVWLPASYLHLLGPLGPVLEAAGWRFDTVDTLLFGGIVEVSWVAGLLAIAFLLPNTQQWVGYLGSEREPEERGETSVFARLAAGLPRWRPTVAYGSALGVILCYCLLAIFAETPSEFLYFQF
jgi:hypothetical protein